MPCVLPDYSAYLTPDRIEAEEAFWPESNRRYSDAVQELCADYGIRALIEVGCGTGWVPSVLSPTFHYLGIDANPHCLERARERNPQRGFRLGDLRSVELPLTPLLCGFAVFKHFDLSEWSAVVSRLLSCSEYALWTMNLAQIDGDDGVDYPHTWVSEMTLARMLEQAGHAELWRRPLWEGTWGPMCGAEVLFATRKEG